MRCPNFLRSYENWGYGPQTIPIFALRVARNDSFCNVIARSVSDEAILLCLSPRIAVQLQFVYRCGIRSRKNEQIADDMARKYRGFWSGD
jgi:hypothetical protein